MYLTLGPWSFDYLLDGSRGVAFAWGTFVEETFLPAAFSYVFDGCVQVRQIDRIDLCNHFVT